MTREECIDLAQYVGALCPQQAIGRHTGLAWHDVLGHLEFAECRHAAAMVAARQPFVAPSEIIAEIADARSAERPHSEACRLGDCRSCRHGVGERAWCMCVCHPRAVKALAGPRPDRPALPAGPRRFEPGALRIGRDADS
jgi:hypothetical protein